MPDPSDPFFLKHASQVARRARYKVKRPPVANRVRQDAVGREFTT